MPAGMHCRIANAEGPSFLLVLLHTLIFKEGAIASYLQAQEEQGCDAQV